MIKFTFIPGSFSISGLQYTGTGTGTLVPILLELEESSEVGVEAAEVDDFCCAGKLHPYACIRPSSFLT